MVVATKIKLKKQRRVSWTVRDKISALEFFDENNLKKTLAKFGCSKGQLYKWKSQKEKLLKLPSVRKHSNGAGRPIRNIEIESLAKEYFDSSRQEGYAVSGISLQKFVKTEAENKDVALKASNMWLYRFKLRHQLVFRQQTSKPQMAPEDEKMSSEFFIKLFDMMRYRYGINDASCILNMDETSLTYDNPRKTTLESKGAKDIAIKTNGHEGCTVTGVFAVCANGEKLPPFIIMKGASKNHKVPSKIQIPAKMTVVAQKRAWNDTEVMKLWIEKIIKPWVDRKKATDYIMILDSAKIHLHEEVKILLEQQNIHPLYIPAGCTAFLQPLDVSTNRSLKSKLRSNWEEWIKLQNAVPTLSGKSFKVPHDEFLTRISEIWDNLTLEVILNGWRKPRYLPLKPQTPKSLSMPPDFVQWLSRS